MGSSPRRRPTMPTAEQVRQLPELLRLTVPAEWEDINGHVNVQHYVAIYDRAGWPLLDWLGIDESRFRVDKLGMFDLEHHIWYVAEIHVGDVVTAHMRFVAQSAKRFQGVMFIVNETRGSLASALEFLTTGADLRTRRTAPLPEDIAQRLREVIDEHSRLDWPVPLCGSIAV